MNSDAIRQALVLGGGGARGALQVGAMRALCESGFRPDFLVGTSAGAINATFMGLNGFTLESLEILAAAWRRAGQIDLLPSNYVWSTLRAVLRRAALEPARNIRDFFVANGVSPELRFADLQSPRVYMVSSDLNTGQPVLHGQNAEDSVLDALLVSTALPPWSMPVRKQGRYLMDGAVVSGLPIEPALRARATSIVALDLVDEREPFGEVDGFGVFFNQVTYAIEKRQVDLELALARAQGVPVRYVSLTSSELVHIWDFQHTAELIDRGYELMQKSLREQPLENEVALRRQMPPVLT